MSEKLETTLDEQGVVTKNAKPGDPMPKSETGTPGQGIQDLGGPTPFNSKPDDESNKMKTGGGPTATPPARRTPREARLPASRASRPSVLGSRGHQVAPTAAARGRVPYKRRNRAGPSPDSR